MTHGGKRAGVGRPATQLDTRRVMVRIARGDTQRAIADDFGVSKHVIEYLVKKQKHK
jgi:hypothetical protein